MVKISIKSNAAEVKKLMDHYWKQIPFATARALTWTAKEAQKDIIAHTKEAFTIRKSWLERGKFSVRVAPATKDNLVASIWNDAVWMMDHEEGALRTPAKRAFAIPTADVKRNKKELITPSNKPSRLKRSFILQTRSGIGILLKRFSKGLTKVMYVFKSRAKIEPRWKFVETGAASVQKNYVRLFEDSFNDAITNSK